MTTRRDVMQGLTVGAAILAAGTQAQAQTTLQVGPAFGVEAEVKPLAFNPAAIDGLSEKLLVSHWQNNYRGSVNALNEIKRRIRTALDDDTLPAYVYNDLKREHLMRTGSVILHEYYFDNIGSTARDGAFDAELNRAFGSVATWEKEFRRIGAGLGGGSGWVMLSWNTHTQALENFWMADHTNAPVAGVPLLVMDMYEHSYHMDYGTAAGQYIDAFMRNVNWNAVAGRLNAALTTD